MCKKTEFAWRNFEEPRGDVRNSQSPDRYVKLRPPDRWPLDGDIRRHIKFSRIGIVSNCQ